MDRAVAACCPRGLGVSANPWVSSLRGHIRGDTYCGVTLGVKGQRPMRKKTNIKWSLPPFWFCFYFMRQILAL